MVLICVTAFNGRHKIQSRWENTEYVVEQHPYTNLPVYVVHPIDGGGHSHTLHRKYLLPISNNLEKEENSVGGDGSNDELTPVSHKHDVLPVECLTESCLEGIPNSPSKQHELYDPGLTRLTSTDPTDGGLKAENDAPVPPRQSSKTKRNQSPWRYQNYVLQQYDILPSAFNTWDGLCIYLHLISCVHMVFVGIK